MSPPASSPATAQSGLRQTVRLPRESDGVGSALRQIFAGHGNLPADFNTLIEQLNDKN